MNRLLASLCLLSPVALGLMAAGGCTEPEALVPETASSVNMAVGETRTVELRHTRFEVEGYVKELTLEDLRRMPVRVLEDIWLLDLDVTPLTTNALEQLRELSAEEVAVRPQAVQNMRTLLTLTPDNVVLDGTNFEELSGLSAAVGIPTARAFGNLLEVGVTDEFVPPDIVAAVIADNLISTHPNAQTRRGPVNDEHPDGVYPVAPHSIPLTMADVVTNFEDLSERFGPTGDHPGFIVEARGVTVIEEDFKMRSRVNVNALPYKGVDLGDASEASVASVGDEVESLHDYDSDDWIELEGLVDDPQVQTLTIRVDENPSFVRGGTSRAPEGKGDSPVWANPVWEFESVLAEMTRRTVERISDHCDDYNLATGVVAFSACIDDAGWVTLDTFNDIGSPPDPAYLWDLNLEIGQARMHDGGLAEGEATVQFTVENVSAGIAPEQLVKQLRENIRANPEALREFATLLLDNAQGDADFFYRRDADADRLVFIAPQDIRLDDEGAPVRDYDTYAAVGFFSNEGLTDPVSSEGEDGRASVEVEPGDVLYTGDDEGAVYRLDVREKPGRARVELDVTRVR
ncbi:MAG: acetyltransferase [Nannocystaceae bacterium]|nr:acetyltransferase [Nannocystaceae bacterium]